MNSFNRYFEISKSLSKKETNTCIFLLVIVSNRLTGDKDEPALCGLDIYSVEWMDRLHIESVAISIHLKILIV